MSKVCDLTGKRPMSGNKVSKSNRKTKRRFYPNLIKKRFFLADTNEWITLKISTSALKTINKIGFETYIQKLEKKGML
ncbi:MAG: large subunit ribosomal protein L28 [Sphingobacteriales bacterium]|jgi:large subunit ribosomal protein L28